MGSSNNEGQRTAIYRVGFREYVEGVAQKLVVTGMLMKRRQAAVEVDGYEKFTGHYSCFYAVDNE